MNILDEIFATKHLEVAERQLTWPLNLVRREAEACAPALDFVAALRQNASANNSPALIAEVKCASPSYGLLIKDFDPIRISIKRTVHPRSAC